ncbi:sec-independent translocase [compost metagenome]
MEREIGADEIRRQLHNEHILSMEREAQKLMAPLTGQQPPAETPASPAAATPAAGETTTATPSAAPAAPASASQTPSVSETPRNP